MFKNLDPLHTDVSETYGIQKSQLCSQEFSIAVSLATMNLFLDEHNAIKVGAF